MLAAVHEGLPEAHGFLFTSWFTGDPCVTVFDRAFGRLQAVDAAEIVQHGEFLNALNQYYILLTGPPA